MAARFVLPVLSALTPVLAAPTTLEPQRSHGLVQRADDERCSPSSLGSDLTIIAYNDLEGNQSDSTAAAIALSNPVSRERAQQACADLGEGLWQPDDVDNDFLHLLEKHDPDASYWIDGDECQAYDATGWSHAASCNATRPVLCTQSAPLSNLTYTDNSTRWQTTVSSRGQSFTGFRDHFSFRFEGVRFAEEPERFTYSQLYTEPGDYDALDFGSQCTQAGGVGSEDCLFLNVWSPSLPLNGEDADESTTEAKPVMFWIHGGAFTGGTGSDPTFDGAAMASRGDVVVVTINYRLGTLGFLALDDGVTNGNYGLADQVTALDWVHRNIRAFGGDPAQITIFGQSAGAASVRALLASPLAAGKFRRSIQQSTPTGLLSAEPYAEYLTIAEEVTLFANPILNLTNCTSTPSPLACLRAVPADTLATQSTPNVAAYLVIDGTYLNVPALPLDGSGLTSSTTAMFGYMRDDGAPFIPYPPANINLTTFLSLAGYLSNPSIPALPSPFPPANISTLAPFLPTPSGPNATLNVFNTSARITTSGAFACANLATAYSASLHPVFDSAPYLYAFNRSYQPPDYTPNGNTCLAPPTEERPDGDPDAEYFKCHSGELLYVFGNLAFNGLPDRDGRDVAFSRYILDSWVSFARHGDPETGLGPRGYAGSPGEESWGRISGGEGEDGDQGREGATEGLRVLQVPGFNEHLGFFDTREECEALGLGRGFWEEMMMMGGL